MEQLYEHFASSVATDPPRPNVEIEVTEIRCHPSSQTPSVETCNINHQNIHKWLSAQSPSHESSCIAKIVLCDKDLKRPWKGSPTALRLVEHFGMRLPYEYARSCVTGVAELPSQDSTMTYIAAHPKLVGLWSVTPTLSSPPCPRVTLQAVIFASPCERARLKGLLSKPWDLSLSSHPMFPAFLFGLAISQEVDSTQEGINEVMRHVEARTGHHNSLKRREEPAQGSWGHLSAKMSGFARKLASTARKIQAATDLQSFMLEHADREPGLGERETAARLIGHHVGVMNARLEMQRRQNDFLVQKVNIQLTAIFNLMARKDSSVGFQSAASMKTLALLALVFLPGNFLAALFSAPLFDWDSAEDDSIGVGMKAQFKLFWVIAIPLTALAFALYTGWSLYEKRRFDRALDGDCSG